LFYKGFWGCCAFYIFLTAPALASTTPPLCKHGTVATFTQSGNDWTWKCEGKYKGTTASCIANAVSTINLGTAVARNDITAYSNKLYVTRGNSASTDNLLDVVDLSNNSASTINLGTAVSRYGMTVYNNKLYITRYGSTTAGIGNLLDVVNLPPPQ